MTELIVIRHGETDWNRQHRFQGQIDVPLNAVGLAQADRLGKRLADEPIDVLVCSDLQRACRTALPLHGPRECDIPNTGINRLRWTGGRLQIVRWADADHLTGLPAQPSTAQLSVPDEA